MMKPELEELINRTRLDKAKVGRAAFTFAMFLLFCATMAALYSLQTLIGFCGGVIASILAAGIVGYSLFGVTRQ